MSTLKRKRYRYY